ncbi:thymidine kinase [Macaca mulatta rhadinovirus 17577]|uniref:Thymidine kinase n=1 Tax=Macaca mulatta rhadinovirus 17577 TaxID=83534 RepID=Q9WRT1_9GAMA|nr:thymidine kinase [Macacine gammaherpesvirus 5]AAD21347.1 thymidine kinase [Macaca mulatta rhadinovirus 17577]WUF06314.1 thymidine kinase [synthetic construct]WVG99621.1 thymidine kinase [Macaca mulatta rhadinovirus]WSP06991.1 thymidine kinase [Macacine gammaherpesvirus 5]WUF06393.1 thymidine kinase [synthetic construct]
MAEGGSGFGDELVRQMRDRKPRWDESSDDTDDVDTESTDLEYDDVFPVVDTHGLMSPGSQNYDVPTSPSGTPWELLHPDALYAHPRCPPKRAVVPGGGARPKVSAFSARLQYVGRQSFGDRETRQLTGAQFSSESEHEYAEIPERTTTRPVESGDKRNFTSGRRGAISGPSSTKPSHGAGLTRKTKTSLSVSLKNLLRIKDDDAKVDVPRPVTVPVHLMQPHPMTEYRNAFLIYLEGVMGVGKTTLLNSMTGMVPQENVLSCPEPMKFWTCVYSNCLKEQRSIVKQGTHGKLITSARVYACQSKFALPFRATAAGIGRNLQPWLVGNGSTKPANWIVFDRHLLSATVVFPLVHVKYNRLTPDHLFQILSLFSAHDGDVVVLLTLNSSEAHRRIQSRGRKEEKGITQNYLRQVAWAYHAVFCTWVMMQYLTPEQMVQLCVQTVSIEDICNMNSRLTHRFLTLTKLHEQSMIPMVAEMLVSVKEHVTLMEVCLGLFKELRKLQILIVDAGEHLDDACGLWGNIYGQVMSNEAIKPRAVNWPALESYIQTLTKLEGNGAY